MLRLLLVLLAARPALAGEPLLLERNERPLDAESTPSALEPWETPIAGFFIRSHHEVPVVDETSFSLSVDGLVERPQRLSLKDLRRFNKRSLHAVLECAGNGRGLLSPPVPGLPWERGAIGNAEWGGAALADVLRAAGVSPKARFARLEGLDLPAMPETPRFIRSVPIEKLLEPDTLLAWEMNREPLPPLHGGPLRLVLPRWYGQNWIKWISRITLTEAEDEGFYMKKGYRMPDGSPITALRVQSLITSPRPGARVRAGRVRVRGKAFSGAGPVARVELSKDGGKTWTAAALSPPRPSGGWQEFEAEVDVPAGPLALLSRAADAAGNVQPAQADWNAGGYLRACVDRLEAVADPDAAPEAPALLQKRCLSCHTEGLIASQRLDRAGWEKVLAKMERFGAILPLEERPSLLEHLLRLSAAAPPTPALLDYARAHARYARNLPQGNLRRGERVYAERCANCHGTKGEGDTGPRLRGRVVPEEMFFAAVSLGRREMPAFAGQVTERQVADLYRFLQRPPDQP